MVIRLKDTAKLFGITIIACCAVFVCTLFLSYNIDLAAIKDEIVTEAGTEMYNAQVLMGRVIAAVSGGCLIATSVVMLLFYVKNYISTHGKELGILKALGYSNIKIARHFWIFGLSVFVGCAVGFVMGYLYLPTFYQKQAPNLQTLIPALKVQFHPLLTFALVGAPTIAFAVISVLFAYLKLKSPVLDLLRERQNVKVRIGRDGKENVPFLKDLRGVTLRSKKSLVFFVAFSAFCFSAMVQMSFSMDELASETFAVMVLSIGLILAFVTLFLSLSSVVKGNTKTIAMMRVFGYDDTTCSRCILGAYRPISYIGFAFGTVYQYGLLRMMVSVVFADIENMPEYGFDFKALTVTLILFVLTYELVIEKSTLGVPMAFAEGNPKERIKNVMKSNTKKIIGFAGLGAVILIVVIAICLIPNRPQYATAKDAITGIPAIATQSATYAAIKTADGNTTITDSEGFNQLLNFIEGIEVNTKEVKRGSWNDSEGNNKITFYRADNSMDSVISFTSDYSKIWIETNATLSFTYSVKDPAEVQKGLAAFLGNNS